MSFAVIHSRALDALEAQAVTVEVHLANGLPSFTLVGLADTEVKESRERVRSAIRNSGARFPHGRVIVNLAPADVRKEGPAYDLPIALGILAASGQARAADALLGESLLVGELGLDGAVRHINGVLSMVSLARAHGLRRVFVPQEDAREAALVGGIEVVPIASLPALLAHLDGTAPIAPQRPIPLDPDDDLAYEGVDLAHIKGQEQVKRGLEVAAAGGHNALATGTEHLHSGL